MKLMRFLLVFAVLGLPAAPIEAATIETVPSAPPGWQRTTWSVRDGAPGYIYSLAQTDDGFLWLGTVKGLVRFDGVRFERYVLPSDEQMPRGEVRSLLALPGNGLMIGWQLGGSGVLREGRLTRYGEAEGYPPGTTHFFQRDASGAIWAATTSGLARFDGRAWKAIGSEWGIPQGPVKHSSVLADGTLAVSKDNVLYTLAPGATRFQGRPSRGPLLTVMKGPGNTFLAMRGDGLSIADTIDEALAGKGRPLLPFKVYVDAVAYNAWPGTHADRRGGIWTLASHAGSMHLAYMADSRLPGNLAIIDAAPDPSIMEDREGNIWISNSLVLHRFSRSLFTVPHKSPSDFAGVLAAPDGAIWSSTDEGEGGRLRLFDRDGIPRYDRAHRLSCLYRDRKGVVWLGAVDNGFARIDRYDQGRFEALSLPPSVRRGFNVQSIAVDTSGAVWASVIRHGVYRHAGGEWSNPAALPGGGLQPAFFLMADSAGRVWASYPGGRIFAWKDGEAQESSGPSGPNIGNVLTIVESGDHMWFGGEGGIARRDAAGGFRRLLFRDTENAGGIVGLVEDARGDLWMASSAGLLRVEAKEVRRSLADPGYRMNHRIFADDDGLEGQTMRLAPIPGLVAGTDGRLWVATTRGLFGAFPEKLSVNPVPPHVVITALVVGDKNVFQGGHVTLPEHTTSLRIDYTATSLSKPVAVRFRYKLDGVDGDWRESGGRREAFYTNLGPGDYRFAVMAANEDGVWTPEARTLNFGIEPAYYQTRWFYAACATLALFALWLLYRARIARLRVQIQARLEERLRERERIARELHDTLLQGFQGLILKFQGILQRAHEPQVRELLASTLASADAVLAEGRDRVRDLREAVGEHEDLRTALEAAASELSHVQEAAFELRVVGEPRPMHPMVEGEAYRLGREALHNAFFHAEAKRIVAEIEYGASRFALRVKDDGKGIDPEIVKAGGVPGHWGIAGMQERARRMDGALEVRGRPGAGTEVELEVPARAAYEQ